MNCGWDMAKALIVEDDSTFRQTLREILCSGVPGIDVSEAGDGETALEKVETFLPDLVFVDIKLPGESGLEVTRKIKRDHVDLVVVVLTHYDSPEYRKAAFEYGANYFLSKAETSQREILALVRSIVSGVDVGLPPS